MSASTSRRLVCELTQFPSITTINTSGFPTIRPRSNERCQPRSCDRAIPLPREALTAVIATSISRSLASRETSARVNTSCPLSSQNTASSAIEPALAKQSGNYTLGLRGQILAARERGTDLLVLQQG